MVEKIIISSYDLYGNELFCVTIYNNISKIDEYNIVLDIDEKCYAVYGDRSKYKIMKTCTYDIPQITTLSKEINISNVKDDIMKGLI